MGKLAKFFGNVKAGIIAAGAIIGFVLWYGWWKFRQGRKMGRALEEHDATTQRIEKDRAEVWKAIKEGDGASLFRKAREWTERDEKDS